MLSRLINVAVLSLLICGLAACGFHLRQNVPLPDSMKRIHLSVNGGGELQRVLARTLRNAGATVEKLPGTGIAEFRVPLANFSTDTLTVGGAAQVTEYSVHFQVQFEVNDGYGQPLIGLQNIQMSREYSYDATNTIGNSSQVEQIQRSLVDDMVQAIQFRLRAAETHPDASKMVSPQALPPVRRSADLP